MVFTTSWRSLFQKVSNGNIRVICEICSKLTIKTVSLTSFWCFLCDFEQVNAGRENIKWDEKLFKYNKARLTNTLDKGILNQEKWMRSVYFLVWKNKCSQIVQQCKFYMNNLLPGFQSLSFCLKLSEDFNLFILRYP